MRWQEIFYYKEGKKKLLKGIFFEQMKKFTIVAGVNGAGKSTLYQFDPDLKCKTE